MNMQQSETQNIAKIEQVLISRKEVQRLTTLSQATIYVQMAKGNFPQSISIGERRVAWLLSEVQEWCDQKIKNARSV
ncbi:helix-turn-helix transcriptional regulator [Acinetobacter gerneri]|uniref:helix-turn-helix transcriptional regulator n=1 Tax=Acinetobacter gerneri TaxID=202952 RepID=UPI0028AB01C8|nr:AlpA family phage regulatory protein [Acinetobacter gerneri]